jgi:serine/threonine-protein kinase HipA
MTVDRSKLNALAVQLHGRRIGVINRLQGERQIFSFEQEYADDSRRPTLSLSFKGQMGGLVTRVRPVSRRVPPFFSNLLPEGPLRKFLAGQARVNPEREFFLLAALGDDLAGAVTVTPLDIDERDHDADVGEDEDAADVARARTPALRFSLAGVQLKFSAMETGKGLTIPAQGMGGSWIVKLPSTSFPSVPENEFVMLALAKAAGINVPPIRLVPINEIGGLPAEAVRLEGRALAVQRFDRAPDGHRIHMEDFAQVFGLFPERKYEGVSYAGIARVLWAETGDAGTYEFFRRLVFSVLIGNGDMHLKNWSLLYPDTRSPTLSPAYDLVSTLPYLPEQRLALTLGGSRSMEEISDEQIRRFIDTAGLPSTPIWRIVHETVERTVAAWAALAEKEILPPNIREVVDKQIQKVAAKTVAGR